MHGDGDHGFVPILTLIWALCWFALALVIAARIAKSAREIASAERRQFALRLTLALASIIVALLVAEGIVRLAHYLREDRRPLEVQLRGARAQAPSSMQSLRLGEIVQPSRYAGIVYELTAERPWTIYGPAAPHQLSGASRLRVHPSQRARHISDRWSR
jgi:hypothetical protein